MIPRAVVDPNVFVSAQISSSGPPAIIGRAVDVRAFELVVSERLLSEKRNVLVRPRFRRYMTEAEVDLLVANLREKGVAHEEGEIRRIVPDDPKDDYLIALALSSDADCLVWGDPHLTGLATDEAAVTVLTPRQFADLLESDEQ